MPRRIATVILRRLGAAPPSPAATTYTLATAGTGRVGAAQAVTVTLDHPATGTVTVTLASAQGTFDDATLAFDGTAGPLTALFTPTAVGAATVSGTNDSGLTNPAPASIAVSAAIVAARVAFGYAPGATLFAIVTDHAGDYAVASTLALEPFNAAHWSSYGFDVPEAATGSGRYVFTFPALAAGDYQVEVYESGGGTPATDIWSGVSGDFSWDGTAFVAPGSGSGSGSSSDPLAAVLPGSYAEGTAGHLIGTALADVEDGITFHKALQVIAAATGGHLSESADHSTSTLSAIGNPGTPRVTSTNTRTNRTPTIL